MFGLAARPVKEGLQSDISLLFPSISFAFEHPPNEPGGTPYGCFTLLPRKILLPDVLNWRRDP
jgi:hypothetical protein